MSKELWTLEHRHSLLSQVGTEVSGHSLKHTRISKAKLCNLVSTVSHHVMCYSAVLM